ncbi:hypothetical protein CHARACLAT_021989 [Characodon lateralis]|uniref:Uncharacterized protein n=1 Tax=Characodon lateralis TaxID=208331 RepID=A0ABU7DBZ9_9TELE|nr:hypothetical protein [Characodon lateralis]
MPRILSPTFICIGDISMIPQSFRLYSKEVRTPNITWATTGIPPLSLKACSLPEMNVLAKVGHISCDDLNCSKNVRDTPDSLPSFVGENQAKKGCSITQMGDNIFAAVQ